MALRLIEEERMNLRLYTSAEDSIKNANDTLSVHAEHFLEKTEIEVNINLLSLYIGITRNTAKLSRHKGLKQVLALTVR